MIRVSKKLLGLDDNTCRAVLARLGGIEPALPHATAQDLQSGFLVYRRA